MHLFVIDQYAKTDIGYNIDPDKCICGALKSSMDTNDRICCHHLKGILPNVFRLILIKYILRYLKYPVYTSSFIFVNLKLESRI